MTSIVASRRAASSRIALSGDIVAVVGLLVLLATLAGLTWGTWGDLDSDTGYDLVAGLRVAHGQLPYADFTYYYGPLSPFVVGLATLIGGHGIWPAVGLGFVLTGAIVAATYALARAYVEPLGAFIAAGLTCAVALAPNNYSFVLPHTYSATLGTLLALGFLLGLKRFESTRARRWIAAAGVLAGLTALTKPEPELAVLAAFAVWSWLQARAGAEWRREARLFAIPALAIPIAVYGALLTQVSAHRLFLENLYPVDQLRQGGNTLLRVRMPLTASSFATQVAEVLLYGAGVAVLLLAARFLATPRFRRAALLVTSLGAMVVVAGSLVDPEALRSYLRYAYAWIPAGSILGLVILARRVRASGRTQSLLSAGLVALVVLAATSYGAFWPHGPKPQVAVYYIPFAAIFLARLHLVELGRNRTAYVLGAIWLGFLVTAGAGLTLKDARADSATVRGPGGALRQPTRTAPLYQGALTWIARETKPGDRILVAPLLTGLYTLSDRDSALAQISLLPGALPRVSDEKAAISRLESAHVRLVITDNRSYKAYGKGPFGQSFDRTLAAWIKTHFTLTASLRTGRTDDRTLDVWLWRAR